MNRRIIVALALFLAVISAAITAMLIVLALIAAIAGPVSDRVGVAIAVAGVLTLCLVAAALFVGLRMIRDAGPFPREVRRSGLAAVALATLSAGVVASSTQTSRWEIALLADATTLVFAVALGRLAFAVLRNLPPPAPHPTTPKERWSR